MSEKIFKSPKPKEKRNLKIMHTFCDGPCWGLSSDDHPLIEFMLSRILFSLIEKGHSADSAIHEINSKLNELSGYDEDPYNHISFEMAFDERCTNPVDN